MNQAVKAMILANGYLKEEGVHIGCIPEFVDVEIDDKVRTAIKLVIEPMQVVSKQILEEKTDIMEVNPEEPLPEI